MPSELSGAQQPITAFFVQGSSQPRLPAGTKRRRNAGSNGPQLQESEPPKKKTKLKENLAPSKRANSTAKSSTPPSPRISSTRRSALADRRKPVAVQTAGFATPSQDSEAALSDDSSKDRRDEGSSPTSGTPPRRRLRLDVPSFLPTPATSVRHRSSISPPLSDLPSASKGFTFQHTLPDRAAATPLPRLPRRNVQLPTPATPPRQRSKTYLQLESSPLSSPPSSPRLVTHRLMDVAPNSHAPSFRFASQTVVPSSQTQTLDGDLFLNFPKAQSSSPRDERFKLPSLPTRDNHAIPTCPSNQIEDTASHSEETCIVPSSQSQDLADFFAPALSPTFTRKHHPSFHIDTGVIGTGHLEPVPDSHIRDTGLQSTPVTSGDHKRSLHRPSSTPTHTGTLSHSNVAHARFIERPSSPSEPHLAHDDIVPTSQYALEKELSSSDFPEIPGVAEMPQLHASPDEMCSEDRRYVCLD